MKKILVASSLVLGGLCAPVFAGPSEYVYSATVEEGEREIDFKFGSRNSKGESNDASAASLGLGYGVNEHWFTEIYFKYARGAGGPTTFDAVEWENRFQLTETGKYPIDVGFLVEIERPQDRTEGYELTWGPLFQTDIGMTTWNANFLIQRYYHAEEPSRATAYYQVQGKYRYRRELEFGFQGFGDLGYWDSWYATRDQGHRFGPAVFGKLPLGGRQAFKYNAAYLVGKNSINGEGIRGDTFRMQLEYEF
jgi:hypothetical protein